MNLKELDLTKLSKLTSEYVDQLKCLECCKYFVAPATAACGHTLCHTCWRSRRTCPLCATSLERKSLKLNLPLQNLTNLIQTLGEAFEKLFKIQLDEFTLDIPPELEPEKDPVKNVKEWLTSSQNHFSPTPYQNSGCSFPLDSQQPKNPLEISASNIIIHSDVKKAVSPTKITKVVHVPPPQDDWDKIESMPDIEKNTQNKDIIVGPMDIEPYFMDENEYTTDNPRRSSRKKDIKYDENNQKIHDISANIHNSRDSSCENDKKTQKSKQNWNNVKRMRKEFSKLNKKNKSRLNVSIEMVKKNQNVKQINNTPLIAMEQAVNIDEDTPCNTEKADETLTVNLNNHHKQDPQSKTNINDNTKNQSQTIKLLTETNLIPSSLDTRIGSNDDFDQENKNVSKTTKNLVLTKDSVSQHSSLQETRMPFIKKSALCPKNIDVVCNNALNIPEHQTTSENSDDIEISIKIGNTITNILIKKKNDMQIKINTDREVQTSLSPYDCSHKRASDNNKNMDNIDINIESAATNKVASINMNSAKTQVGSVIDKSTSGKKGTASADTATVQFEITESVEKELSNIMEYEAAEEKNEIPKVSKANDNHDNFEDLNDLDIFSGSIKETNVQHLKEHAPSEILISTVCNKIKTQRNVDKRNRDNTDEETLPKNKKMKVTTQQKANDKSMLPDSEPINYDAIMGQVFASIDADMEDIRNSQDTENTKTALDNKLNNKNKDLSKGQNTKIIKHSSHANHISTTNLKEYCGEKHSENVFSNLGKDDDNAVNDNHNKEPQQVEELLTPVLCHNLESSQEGYEVLHKNNKLNKKTQDYDSDRSVVEETPQKDLSFAKIKRSSTSNLSQITLSQTKKNPSKTSIHSVKSIINLTDTVSESNKSSRDVTIVEPAGKKVTLETPLTITKFADHIIHKSTPVARKSLNFDNEDNDPEQTLCPTSEIVAKTTQEKEFMSKAFERTPTTPAARPLMARNFQTKMNIKYCLAASRLTSDEIAKVKILCSQWNWSYTEKYSKDITHLVVSVDEENKSQRSVKYMCALADSKWIISFDWINRCLCTKQIVDEEDFEALDSFGEPGPRRSRLAKQKLFQGIKFYCMPPFSVLDVVTLKNMLVAAGGRVVKEVKEVKVTKDSTQPALLLAEPEHTQEDRFIYLAMEQSIVPVNFEWILNCLGSYSLGSIQELLLCPSSLLPPATASWPEVLLAQEYD